MSDAKGQVSVRLVGAVPLLLIMFWGEPDIVDAVIHWLMGCR